MIRGGGVLVLGSCCVLRRRLCRWEWGVIRGGGVLVLGSCCVLRRRLCRWEWGVIRGGGSSTRELLCTEEEIV